MSFQYDVVTIGGGLGASAFATSMAKQGVRVLILEKETQFKDRVRGEYLVPWGMAEAKQLGVEAVLINSCATALPFIDMGFGPRNLIETTVQQLPALSFFHPEMQQTLLAEAERAGAVVKRGVTVTSIQQGIHPSLTAISNGGPEEHIVARLIVAADGRGSPARKWAGFSTRKDAEPYHFAGVLLDGLSVPRDLCTFIFNPDVGLVGGIVPQTANRSRMYLGYSTERGFSLQGKEKLGTFLEQARRVGPVFGDCSAQAKSLGPVAAFEGGFFWVDRPYRDGVALIGDAAGTSDPTFGQGMSLTLRDARILRDTLMSTSDWDFAGKHYAEQHDTYFQRIRTVCGWTRSLFQKQGAEADAQRQKAMPKIAEDLTRVPDHLFSGPELPVNENVRARFFGEC